MSTYIFISNGHDNESLYGIMILKDKKGRIIVVTAKSSVFVYCVVRLYSVIAISYRQEKAYSMVLFIYIFVYVERH